MRRGTAALALGLIVVIVIALVGREGDGSGGGRSSDRSGDSRSSPSETTTTRSPAPRAHTSSAACPPARRALDGVYHPERLRVLDPCRTVSGRVTVLRKEEDGDLHFDLELDRRYRAMLAPANLTRQHGDLVVEFMPRDRGHMPVPKVGDRVSTVGAFVDDIDHAWNELHPVWQVSLNGGRRFRSGPRYGGSPPAARSKNAVSECRKPGGRVCQAYLGP